MPYTSHHFGQQPHSATHNPMLVRLCIGVLGLFPIVTLALMAVVYSLPIAIVMAGVGAVTVMSLLPRGDGRRS